MSRRRFVTLGWEIIDWIEHYLCHGPGDVQGEPIILDDEFARFILLAYELNPPEWRRKIRRAFLSRVKGRAKSELAGMLCCVEALGPVRFDGFNSKREPVGKPITYPYIRCLATEEGQSGNTYDNVFVMLSHVAEHFGDEFPGLDIGLTRTYLPDGGEVVPSSASNAAKDGGKETFVVFDETHLYKTPELKRMHATVRRNATKRKIADPWSLETSTMYEPGERSVAQETHEYAEAIIDGRIKDDSLLFDHRQGPSPEEFDWDDDKALRAALINAYGEGAEWMDFDRLIKDIRDPQTEKVDAQRYFLNIVVQSEDRAFDIARWDEFAKPKIVVPDKELITVGFDGSKFEDATALIGTHLESGHQFVIEIWERPYGAQGDEWEVSDQEVDDAVTAAFDRWKVVRFYGDPPYWETPMSNWAARYGSERVHEWWTHRTKPMAYALKAYVTAQRTGGLSHDGDSQFTQHIRNARKRFTRMYDDNGQRLWVIHKDRPNSPNKIDGAMAGCLSWEARNDAIAAGALKKKGRKKPARLVSF